MNKIKSFISLARIFAKNGYCLYLTGGTVRDYLLNHNLADMDVCTDATPKQVLSFLENIDKTFIKYGSLKCIYQDIKFDISTLRTESNYIDYRHPSQINFIKTIKEDHYRRDFTINAMYLDMNLKLYDFENGEKDIARKNIRMIGEPNARLKEDPLRIIRAIRFSIDLGFSIDNNLSLAIKKNAHLLAKINADKIKQEISKIKCQDIAIVRKSFDLFGILKYLDMIK